MVENIYVNYTQHSVFAIKSRRLYDLLLSVVICLILIMWWRAFVSFLFFLFLWRRYAGKLSGRMIEFIRIKALLIYIYHMLGSFDSCCIKFCVSSNPYIRGTSTSYLKKVRHWFVLYFCCNLRHALYSIHMLRNCFLHAFSKAFCTCLV